MHSLENETFLATTVYDEAAYTALVNLMMKKLRRWPRIVILVTGFASVIAGGLFMLLEGQASGGPFLVMMVGSMMCMLGFLAPYFSVRMMLAENKKQGVPQNSYRFTPEEIQVQTKDNEKRYSYAFVARMLEMSGYLFMFMKDGQVFLLRQSDVKGGYARLHEELNRRLEQARSHGA